MGWIIKALAKTILSIIDSLMVWTASLFEDLNLDIGMSKNGGPWAFVDPGTAGKYGLLGQTFPGAEKYCYYFAMLAMMLVFIIMIFKLYQGFISPFTDAEPPGTVVVRSILAAVGVMSSYTIFVTFERLFNTVYLKFKTLFNASVKKANFNQFKDDATKAKEALTEGQNRYQGEASDVGTRSGDGSISHVNQFWGSEKLINSSKDAGNITGGGDGDGFSLIIVELLLGIAIVTMFVKLVLEIYQRYITLGLLFYTCPLAFAMLASKGTKNIFSNWLQMLFSQFILMCMNLFFVGVFIDAFVNLLSIPKGQKYIFENDVEFVTTMLLLLGWLVVGQRVDEYMKGLGLSVANTGAGLGGALLAGGYATASMLRGAGRVAGKGISAGLPKGIDKLKSAFSPGDTMAMGMAERAAQAGEDLAGAAVGSMSGNDFHQNVMDRDGLNGVGDVNSSKVDWDNSSALSGEGAQILSAENGIEDGKINSAGILSESAIEGSPAAQQMQEMGSVMEIGNGMIAPVYPEQLDHMSAEIVSAAERGQLKSMYGSGIDHTKYEALPIDPSNPHERTFVNKEKGVSRTISTRDYFNIKGADNLLTKGDFAKVMAEKNEMLTNKDKN